MRVGGDVVVHEPRRLHREADRLPGDPPGSPRRQLTDHDTRPGLGEPVSELDGLAEVLLAGLGREPDRERELRHAELRHQRCTRSGDRQRLVTERRQQRRFVDRLGRVQVRPRDCVLQELDLGQVGHLSTVAGVLEDRLCGVESGARGHASILLEHMFESSFDSDYFRRLFGGVARPPQPPECASRELTATAAVPLSVAALLNHPQPGGFETGAGRPPQPPECASREPARNAVASL